MKALISFLLLISFSVMAQVSQIQGPVQIKPFADKTGFKFMPDSAECLFSKSTNGSYNETTCDYTIPFNAKLDGVQMILQNHSWADYAYITVHHPVAGEVGRFGQKIMFDNSKQRQDWIQTSYDAELAQGLIIKLHYATKGTVSDVNAIINFRLHKIVP